MYKWGNICMLRKLTLLTVGIVLLCSITIATVKAESTVYVPPLAFNVVSALAKEQDLQKGLETSLKEQNVTWFWELGGGMEKAMTANSEAEFTDMLNKNVETVKTLYSVGMQYAEGKYTDMAITITDAAIGKLNNPAATAVWEMVKLTRESYKAVEASQDALNIEMLYSVVNKDRRIIGESKGGAPVTININSQTVDYFFDKYLITDASVRAMVKSYVEKSLGQSWPEQSWKDYMIGLAAVGSGIDTKEEAELRQLQSEEFRNVARGWIRSLLADVNKQVTLEYYRTRVRQEMAEYSQYAKKVGTYYESGYPVMWKILRQKKNAIQNIPTYKEDLKAALKDIASANIAYQAVAKSTEKQKEKCFDTWLAILNPHDRKLLEDAAGAYIADATTLNREIEKARDDIQKFRAIYSKYIETAYDGESEVNPDWTGRTDNEGNLMPDYFGAEVMVEQYFKPLIVLEDIDSHEAAVDTVIDDAVKLLNQGDFNGTNLLFANKLGKAKTSVWADVYELMDEASIKLNEMCNPSQDFAKMSNPDLKAHAQENAQYAKRIQPKLKQEYVNEKYEDALKYYIEQWKIACNIAQEDMARVHAINNAKIAEKNSKTGAVYDAYKAMSDAANVNYKRITALMNNISEMIRDTASLRNLDTNGKSLYKAEGDKADWCPDAPADKDAPLLSVDADLYNRALKEGGVGGSASYVMELESFIDKTISEHEAAFEMWNEQGKISAEDLQMIGIFVDGAEGFSKIVKDMDERISYIPDYVSAERADTNKYIARLLPASQRCTSEHDRFVLYSDAFKEWEEKITKSGVFKVNSNKLVYTKIHADINTGMAKVEKPYSHYLTENELKDEMTDLMQYALPSGLRAYLASAYPGAFQEYSALFGLTDIKPAPDENIILNNIIYLGDVKDVQKQVTNATVGTEEFINLMASISEKLPDLVKKHSATYLIFEPQTDGMEATFDTSTGKAYATLAKSIKQRWDEHNNAILAEMQANEEAGQKELNKKLEEMFGGELKPLDSDDYWIVDPRVNYQPYPEMGGKVILTTQDTISGKIYFTGTINTLSNVEKVLFSIDGGRSWTERNLAPVINAEVTPYPNTNYNPVVKLIRPDGFEPIELSFSNESTVTYSSESSAKRILDAVKQIADAYERQDLMTFDNLISENFAGGYSALEEGVRFDFEMFTSIRLKIYVNRIIELGSGRYAISTKWDKTHIPRSTGSEQKTSGQTVITLVSEAEQMKIQNLRGDLLYATLSPDIAVASGLSTTIVDEITDARDNRTPSQPGAGTFSGTTGSGGGSSGGSIIAINTVTRNNYSPAFAFDFDTGNLQTGITPGPGAIPTWADVTFEGDPWFSENSAVFIDMSGSNTFANLNTAPDAGYAALDWTANLPSDVGKVYAFITSSGNYGKLEIISASVDGGTGNGNISFKYAIQTDGSKNIATQ